MTDSTQLIDRKVVVRLGAAGVLVGCILSGLITWFAVGHVDRTAPRQQIDAIVAAPSTTAAPATTTVPATTTSTTVIPVAPPVAVPTATAPSLDERVDVLENRVDAIEETEPVPPSTIVTPVTVGPGPPCDDCGP